MKLGAQTFVIMLWISACKTAAPPSNPEGFFDVTLDSISATDERCPPTKTLFYHWGPGGRVTPWLEGIGYQTGGSPAPVSNQLINDILATSNEEALLGRGLYLADAPMETVKYGDTLLVLAAQKVDHSVPCRVLNDGNTRSFVGLDAKAKAARAEKLSTFVAYVPIAISFPERQPTFYILRQLPAVKEKLALTIRRATAKDAELAWEELQKLPPTKTRLEKGYLQLPVEQTLLAFLDSKKPMDQSSKEFLSTLIGDYYLPYVLTAKQPSAAICKLARNAFPDRVGAKRCQELGLGN